MTFVTRKLGHSPCERLPAGYMKTRRRHPAPEGLGRYFIRLTNRNRSW